jgi:hypothetical protein
MQPFSRIPPIDRAHDDHGPSVRNERIATPADEDLDYFLRRPQPLATQVTVPAPVRAMARCAPVLPPAASAEAQGQAVPSTTDLALRQPGPFTTPEAMRQPGPFTMAEAQRQPVPSTTANAPGQPGRFTTTTAEAPGQPAARLAHVVSLCSARPLAALFAR